MKRLSGGCQCGRVRYTADVEPGEAYACHCGMCRKATGGAWGAYVNVVMNSVKWQGKPDWHQSSAIAHRAFCSHCGTPIGFAYLEDMAHVDLTIGSFDEPEHFQPVRNLAVEGMLPAWTDVSCLPGQRSDENPEIVRRWREAGVEPAR
jgi:hypothetical protein